MIYGFVGLLGQGKTTGMVTYARDLHELEGYKIMANFHVKFSELINPLELIDFEIDNCVLLIDEAYTLVDSRYASQANRHLGYFFKQSRKRRVHVFYTSQSFGDVDKRLREITDRVVLCFKTEGEGFTFIVTERGIHVDTKYLPWKAAENFVFNQFDTYEIIMPPTISDNVTTIPHLSELLEAASNMPTFITLLRTENPYLPVDTVKSIYTLMRAKRPDLVEKLLRHGNKRDELGPKQLVDN